MRWLDRLPQPRGGWASPVLFLEMTEDEYRPLLEQYGSGDTYIEKELRLLSEARQRHDLPGPPEPKSEKPTGGGPFDRLARRRKGRGEGIDDQQAE